MKKISEDFVNFCLRQNPEADKKYFVDAICDGQVLTDLDICQEDAEEIHSDLMKMKNITRAYIVRQGEVVAEIMTHLPNGSQVEFGYFSIGRLVFDRKVGKISRAKKWDITYPRSLSDEDYSQAKLYYDGNFLVES